MLRDHSTVLKIDLISPLKDNLPLKYANVSRPFYIKEDTKFLDAYIDHNDKGREY